MYCVVYYGFHMYVMNHVVGKSQSCGTPVHEQPSVQE